MKGDVLIPNQRMLADFRPYGLSIPVLPSEGLKSCKDWTINQLEAGAVRALTSLELQFSRPFESQRQEADELDRVAVVFLTLGENEPQPTQGLLTRTRDGDRPFYDLIVDDPKGGSAVIFDTRLSLDDTSDYTDENYREALQGVIIGTHLIRGNLGPSWVVIPGDAETPSIDLPLHGLSYVAFTAIRGASAHEDATAG